MTDTRIPIEDFEDFATCRLVGYQFGQRYEAFCEAFAASLADPELRQQRAPDRRQETIALRGREPHASYCSDVDFNQVVRLIEALPVPGGRVG